MVASSAASAQALSRGRLRHLGLQAPTIAMMLGFILATMGLLEPAGKHEALIAAVWDKAMPAACCLHLLETDLRDVLSVGPLFAAFAVGAAGTAVGAFIAFIAIRPLGSAAVTWQLAAALCASYVGGSVNFVAVGAALGLSSAAMAAGLAADNLAFSIYLAILMALGAGRPSNDLLLSNMRSPERAESKGGAAGEDGGSNATTLGRAIATAALCCLGGEATCSIAGLPEFSLAAAAMLASAVGALAPWMGAVRGAGWRPETQRRGRDARVFAGAADLGEAIMGECATSCCSASHLHFRSDTHARATHHGRRILHMHRGERRAAGASRQRLGRGAPNLHFPRRAARRACGGCVWVGKPASGLGSEGFAPGIQRQRGRARDGVRDGDGDGVACARPGEHDCRHARVRTWKSGGVGRGRFASFHRVDTHN